MVRVSFCFVIQKYQVNQFLKKNQLKFPSQAYIYYYYLKIEIKKHLIRNSKSKSDDDDDGNYI